jgi:hypothetical protein
MDDRLSKALDFANYRQTLAVQRKLLKEKSDAKLTYGHASGLFKIDRNLISFVQFLIDQGRTENIPMIDDNGNPIMIEDLIKFRDEILERYFTSVFEYYSEYQKIKQSRTVEKLTDL